MREPIFKIPGVILALLAVLILIQIAMNLLPPEASLKVMALFGFTPARFAFLFNQSAVIDHLNAVARASRVDGELSQFFLTYGRPQEMWVTPLTYAFLHGGWTHLTVNGAMLAAFGSPVARRFGTLRFLLLGVIGAVLGALVQFAANFVELAPMIGASAGISAYMGAAARFVFQPGMLFRSFEAVDPEPPLATLREAFVNPQVLAFVAFWFGINLLIGLGGQELGFSRAPIAWQAHIGGFLAGLFLAPLFDQRRKQG